MSLLCGGGGAAAEGTPEELEANRKLMQMQKTEEEKETKIIKMLLLGAGESGKSTIFKQMKVINKNGYTEKERKEFKTIVHTNVCQSMRSIVDAFAKLNEDMPADFKSMVSTFDGIEEEKIDTAAGELIKKMWEHPSIQDPNNGLFKRRNEFQLNDSAEYYFQDVMRLCAADYIPSEQDVLRSRVRTTGIVQSDFTIKNLNFKMFDVGGQRNERRKWIHCFDNVNAVVFVASLSEFDQNLYEDESKNRLDEALELFQQISNSKWFAETSLILFLNKKDLFEKKLEEGKVFADYVKGYSGPNQLKETSDHVKKLMLERCKNKDKSIFTHVTTATDTKNVSHVFNAVVAMILEANLKASGLA